MRVSERNVDIAVVALAMVDKEFGYTYTVYEDLIIILNL